MLQKKRKHPQADKIKTWREWNIQKYKHWEQAGEQGCDLQ